MKLLQGERISHRFTNPCRVFTTEYNGNLITINHSDYGFLEDARLAPETEVLPKLIPFSIGGIPAKYKWTENRNQKGFDGWLIYGGKEEKVSCRGVTIAMMKNRNLCLHKSVGNGGGRENYSETNKENDIKDVEWHLFFDIRDEKYWWLYLVENEAILKTINQIWQESYKYKWTAQEFDIFVSKYGYVKQNLKNVI